MTIGDDIRRRVGTACLGFGFATFLYSVFNVAWLTTETGLSRFGVLSHFGFFAVTLIIAFSTIALSRLPERLPDSNLRLNVLGMTALFYLAATMFPLPWWMFRVIHPAMLLMLLKIGLIASLAAFMLGLKAVEANSRP